MLEQTITNLNAQISRINQERMLLETELRSRKDAQQQLSTPVVVEAPQSAVKNERVAELDREIAAYEKGLTDLRERFRDDHPEVQRVRDLLKVRQDERERMQSEAAAAAARTDPNTRPRVMTPRGNTREALGLQNDINRLQAQIQAKDIELEEVSRQLKENRDRIRVLNNQLDMSPAAQMQFGELLRERDRLQENFEKLSDKLDITKMADELEQRKQGELLEQLDPPFMPKDPKYPRREFIIPLGAVIGLLLGLVTAGVREMRDTSLKSLKDVRAYTKLTVLASIPLLENDFVVRRRRRLTWIAWAVAVLFSIFLMVGAIAYYITTKG
jgi:uncharacterized protein involved in exopolysaccharide biosynthesis